MNSKDFPAYPGMFRVEAGAGEGDPGWGAGMIPSNGGIIFKHEGCTSMKVRL